MTIIPPPSPPPSARMLAAVYDDYNAPIQIKSVPIPSIPPDGVLIAVKATGVCRSDWHGWKGHDGDITAHGLPFIPGHELSGIITAVGPQTTKFKPGDAVAIPFILHCGSCPSCHSHRYTVCHDQQQPGFTTYGSFAEYVALPRADRNLCHLPSHVSFVQAAAMGCRFGTAYRAVVERGRWRGEGGEVMVVFGCGGLGLSCVMVGVGCCSDENRRGDVVKVVAVDVSTAALEKAKELGAWRVIHARRGEKDAVSRRVMELTDGRGADLTIDAAGFAATCEMAIECVRRGGRMVQVGLPLGGDEENSNATTNPHPVVPMALVAGREIEIVGSHGFTGHVDFPKMFQLIRDGRIDPAKLVEREVTLEEGAKAIEDMDFGSPIGMTMVTKFKTQSRL